jgi:hypothetical protein
LLQRGARRSLDCARAGARAAIAEANDIRVRDRELHVDLNLNLNTTLDVVVDRQLIAEPMDQREIAHGVVTMLTRMT